MKTYELLDEDKPKDLVRHHGEYNYSSYKVGMNNEYMKQAFQNGLGRDLDVVGMPMSLSNWRNLMNSTPAGVYNDFDADKVYSWILYNIDGLDKLQFIPAREGSVALYILGPIEYLKQIKNTIDMRMPELIKPDEIHVTDSNKAMRPGFPQRLDPQSKPNSGWKRIGKNLPLLRLWWD